jgi:WD40 repeat protein
MKIELSHDILARKIYDKSSTEDKLVLKIENLIREDYQRFVDRKILMGKEDYEYVAPFLSSLNLIEEEKAFVRKSKRAIDRRQRRRNILIIAVMAILALSGAWAVYQQSVAKTQESEAIYQAELAKEQKRAAEKARAEAEVAKAEADELRKQAEQNAKELGRQAIFAERQRQIAVINERKAKVQTIIAEQQTREALNARSEAEGLKLFAEKSALEAKTNAKEAKRNALKAEKNEKLALVNQAKALASAKQANELKDLSDARVKANNAIRLILGGKLLEGANLAVEANEQNKEAGGPTVNSDCYQALDFAYQAFIQEEIDKKGDSEKPLYQTQDAAIRCIATAFDANNKEITAYATEDRNLFIVRKDKAPKKIVLSDRPRSITFSHGGDFLFVGTVNGKLLAFENQKEQFERRKIDMVTSGSSIGYINAFSPSQGVYYVAYTDESTLHLGSILKNPKRTTNLTFSRKQRISLKNIQAAAFSNDGKYALIANDKEFQVHEINYNTVNKTIESTKLIETRSLKGLNVTSTAIGKNEEGFLFALGFKNGAVHIANVSTLGCLIESRNCEYNIPSEHKSSITKLVFREDGKQLITASLDKTGKIWNLENIEDERIPLISHRKWIWDVAYSQDQKTIYTVSEDRSIRVWLSSAETLEARVRGYIFKNRRSNDFKTKGDDTEKKPFRNAPKDEKN